nr:unnamed protein product [Callosobruchus chinensis]
MYFLNNGEERLQICRQMFINTYYLGYKTIQEWVSKSSYGMGVDSVQNNEAKQLKERYSEKYKCLRMFFDNLPKLPAHYCRKGTTKL